jgi:methyl-accepting chemotaxis protein
MFNIRKLSVLVWIKAALPTFTYLVQIVLIYLSLQSVYHSFQNVEKVHESLMINGDRTIHSNESSQIEDGHDNVRKSLENTRMMLIVTAILQTAVLTYFIQSVKSSISDRLRHIANDLSKFSSEITQTMELQQENTAQQATAVHQTTTTMDELSASSQQSAEQASAAALDASQGLGLSQSGLKAVKRTQSAMSLLTRQVGDMQAQIANLTEKTNQIGSISKLVTDLANQTNMLALNAAVEAVRAGEHGKGFAIVAQEIRKLADQSKASTRSINDLVTDIQMAIESTVMATQEGEKTAADGAKIAQETAEVFQRLTDSINNISLNAQQISLNTKQQALAIHQVVDAMNNINQTAAQTAVGIGQVKLGSEQLDKTVQTLKKIV